MLTQEDIEVRILATVVLYNIVKRMLRHAPWASLNHEIDRFLVPLLLNLQEEDTNLIKVTVGPALPPSVQSIPLCLS